MATTGPVFTYTLEESAYVVGLAELDGLYAAATSAPANHIHALDRSRLHKVWSAVAHTHGGTSPLRTVGAFPGRAGPTLISSGLDGTVKVWDERTGSAALTCAHTSLVA